MRFSFVDRVLALEPGVSITTRKCLTLGEEYLADHFPRFPVMPGVLMLEAMTEAGAWLIRVSEDFAHSMITLKEARNIKYADFVRPGRVLSVKAEILSRKADEAQLKAQCSMDGRIAVSGRLVLTCSNLRDSRPDLAASDAALERVFRNHWNIIYSPDDESAADIEAEKAATAGVTLGKPPAYGAEG